MAEPMRDHDDTRKVPPDSFALRLVVLRHTCGRLTQEEAAARAGVNPKTWATWELGRKPQKMDEVVKRIADAFDCDRGWLMFGGALNMTCFTGPHLAAVPDPDGPLPLTLDFDAVPPSLTLAGSVTAR